MSVPRSPQDFFQIFLPANVAANVPIAAGWSSPGSLVVRVDDAAWSLRVRDGTVETAPGVADDGILNVEMNESVFARFVVPAAERGAQRPGAGAPQVARALALAPEQIDAVRALAGSITIALRDDGEEHLLHVSPGPQPRHPASCTIRMTLADLVDLEMGRIQPVQLLFSGQMVLEGDAQIVMGLIAALA